MALNTAKAIEVLFGNAIDEYQLNTHMLGLTSMFMPDSATMQNASNIIWREVDQQAPIKEGWDLAGQFGDVIQQYYPATLETPKNDAFTLRADDVRDISFWENRGKESGEKQALFLNERIARLIVESGSLFYRQAAAANSGFEFCNEANILYAERQIARGGVANMVLNARDNGVFAGDLANRGTLVDRPETAYASGFIGRNVAGLDIYQGNYLQSLVGGPTPPGVTVTGQQRFRPEGQRSVAGVDTNIDYRTATISVSDSSDFNVGDRIKFTNTTTTNGSADVLAIGLGDKTISASPMTFVVRGKPSGTSLDIWPKPIALDDTGASPQLTPEEAAYANVNTTIKNGAAVVRLNIDPLVQPNIFWAPDSIEVVGGDAPLELLNQFAGMQVMSETMENGQRMYLIYDGEIDDLSFKARLFTWWGLTNKRPSANGIGIRALA